MQNTGKQFDAFLLKPRGDKVFRLQVSRNTLVAIVVSLLIHAIILFFIMPLNEEQAASLPARELEVSLAPPTLAQKKAENLENPPVKKPASRVKKSKKTLTTQRPSLDAKPVFKVPDVLTIEKTASEKVSPKLTIPPNLSIPKVPPQKEPPIDAAPTDMMAYVNQQRAKRESLESDAASQNAEATARELGPTAEKTRDENIKRNLQNGTNGIFEITRIGNNSASFTFRGWTKDFNSSTKQYFVVEGNTVQDVQLNVIKKIINLIREHYQGDFNWESHRLNRTIVMSARLEDNEGLEDFMRMEFFGAKHNTGF